MSFDIRVFLLMVDGLWAISWWAGGLEGGALLTSNAPGNYILVFVGHHDGDAGLPVIIRTTDGLEHCSFRAISIVYLSPKYNRTFLGLGVLQVKLKHVQDAHKSADSVLASYTLGELDIVMVHCCGDGHRTTKPCLSCYF